MDKWQVGDRVYRLTFMDDGTWAREGDRCLDRSPKKFGTVISRSQNRDDEVEVLFDDGMRRRFLDHGLDAAGWHAARNWRWTNCSSF